MSSWHWIEGQGYMPHSLRSEPKNRLWPPHSLRSDMPYTYGEPLPAPLDTTTHDPLECSVCREEVLDNAPMDTAESVQADREVGEVAKLLEIEDKLHKQSYDRGYRRGLEDAARRIVKAEAGRIRRGFNG